MLPWEQTHLSLEGATGDGRHCGLISWLSGKVGWCGRGQHGVGGASVVWAGPVWCGRGQCGVGGASVVWAGPVWCGRCQCGVGTLAKSFDD